ncbi:MAG TPA: acyl-CoA dehydrogenase C-terminal domain-containing protein [Gemmatimonadaceae bacterium]|nr:acyl-CoA dehydrogenase C-terminal domain-containing protein [Gemmatimonadaceae bacterium]
MPTYRAPLDDIRFLLQDVLDVGQLAALPGFADATPDVVLAVLEEGARLCEEVLAPLNAVGDQEGCRFEHGVVTTPTGFRAAYDAFREGGWTAMTGDPEYGGQGMPHVVRYVFDEMLCSANLSFSMYPELAHGAITLLERWADDELKRLYLPKLLDGSWSGTMCLTEPQAGTDLGIIRTKAVPAGDGAYLVSGTKIFISAGDHDLTENIVHLVLARLPDAPAGTRGISLFLVPKFRPTEDGRPGTRNGVTVGSIEHKMGIKGNATCVLNFDGATGWLVGEPNKGLRAMFTMMNGARLGVGMQGLGLAEVSRQNAAAYARERLQGRALTGPAAPELEADPIVVHPDVRRMLLTMKAYVEGMRALAYWTALELDVEHHHPDPAEREVAADLVALMTPVVKAFLTDVGFEVTNLALQCYGGHGYIREFGVEQFVRDARIAQIYEGTNGVQAMDLIGRKVPEGDGRLVQRFAALVRADVERALGGDGDTGGAGGAGRELAGALAKAMQALQETTLGVMERARRNPDELGAAAVDYLRLFGLVATGWMWLRMVQAAEAKLAAGDGDRAFLEAKLQTARFYAAKLLPQTRALQATIAAGAEPVMAIDATVL